MTRHYSPYDTAPTERFSDGAPGYDGYDSYDGYRRHDGYRNNRYDEYEDYDADYPADDVTFYEDPIDRRWIWVAAVAGAVLLVAVICTVVILGGGDSGSVSATVTNPVQPSPTSQPTQDAEATAVPPRAAPTAPLSPETVTTVTPEPSAIAPPVAPAPLPPPAEAAPPINTLPNAITYRVTGNRQLIDLVTIVYTDAQGALQTDINVALPWVKTVVLNPGVTLKSVTGTSVAGQLNCSITDSSGNVLVEQTNNAMITTCTQ